MTNPLEYTPDVQGMMEQFFQHLDKHWTGDQPDQGMHRPGYSEQEQEAMDIAANYAAHLGQEVYRDAAGNYIFITQGSHAGAPIQLGGSHMDAVPHGGRFDGPAGVAVRLAATRILQNAGYQPRRGYGTIVFRHEESPWFGVFGLGSKFATAAAPSSILDKRRVELDKTLGKTLAQHMADIKIDPDALARMLDAKKPTIPFADVSSFLETHIEQGPLLMEAGKDIGLVTDIRGNVRFQGEGAITFNGLAGHTGSTPTARRRNAATMAADFIVKFETYIAGLQIERHDIVGETTDIDVPNPSGTTIPAECRVSLDIRSIDWQMLYDASQHVPQIARDIAVRRGGSVSIDERRIVTNASALMNRPMIKSLEGIARDYGIRTEYMQSGAGHDAAIIANRAKIATAMLFIAHGNGGVSHRPDEIMGLHPGDNPVATGSAFARAALLNAHYIMASDNAHPTRSPGFVANLKARGGQALVVG